MEILLNLVKIRNSSNTITGNFNLTAKVKILE